MAGGVGTRFWPASRSYKPKQFLDILNIGKTLIQSTIDRLLPVVDIQQMFVLTNAKFKNLVNEQVPNIRKDRILFEPSMRNTAPAVAYVAYKVFKENPEGLIAVLPSDHIIGKEELYQSKLELAFQMAEKGNCIVTLGIQPDEPNTGFGYIQYGKEAEENVFEVKRFVEKPDQATAQEYLEEGSYLWNAGMFISSARYLVESFEKYAPDVARIFKEGFEHLNTETEASFIEENYQHCQNISIDYAIMEKAESVYVIPADIGWSDLGAWPAMYDDSEKDETGNVISVSNIDISNTSGTIVQSSHANKLYVLDGMTDFMIVDIDDILYIAPRERVKDIKQIRTRIIEEQGKKWS